MRLGKWGAMKIKRICQIDRQTAQSGDVWQNGMRSKKKHSSEDEDEETLARWPCPILPGQFGRYHLKFSWSSLFAFIAYSWHDWYDDAFRAIPAIFNIYKKFASFLWWKNPAMLSHLWFVGSRPIGEVLRCSCQWSWGLLHHVETFATEESEKDQSPLFVPGKMQTGVCNASYVSYN